MSRVDDDRQAQRVVERLALEKRQQEDRTQKSQEGQSAFSKVLGQRQGLVQEKDARARQSDAAGADAKEQVGKDGSVKEKGEGRRTQERAGGTRGEAAFGERLKQAGAGEGERASEGRLADAGKEGFAAGGRSQDQRAQEGRAESRRQDAQRGHQSHGERGESATLAGAGAGRGARDKEVRPDADGGGGKGGGQNKEGKDPGAELSAGFRFNPALMAPVPVAKPRENTGSERLRALANEIAQKIVERVRVGTNALGKAEFQIDLRSDVLAGLSIKVSGGNGKIRAVFSGSDRKVLALLEEQADSLRQALGGRGLTLEEFKIEERA